MGSNLECIVDLHKPSELDKQCEVRHWKKVAYLRLTTLDQDQEIHLLTCDKAIYLQYL